MNKAKRNNIIVMACVLALLPAVALADTTDTTDTTAAASAQTTTQTVPNTQGLTAILSCNQNGADAMSVGALGATGGVYVPVADATVELNTGTLVYKECVLREVVDAERMYATAGYTQQATAEVLYGRGGSAEFVVQQTYETTVVQVNALVAFVQNETSSLDPNIVAQVKNAILQGASVAAYNTASMLTCPYAGASASFSNPNAQFSWNNILAIASPCNPIFGYMDANNLANSYAAQEVTCQENQWQWGGGFYSVTTGSGGPCEQNIVTPSSEVNGLYSQVLQSPYDQLQSANDIGQLVGPLFAGISTAVLSNTQGGISGIDQAQGGSQSYLQQAVSQEAQNVQSNVANAALTNLQEALTVETDYNNTMNLIAGDLESAISALRGSENECWQQIVQQVCQGGTVSANGTCQEAVQCTTASDGTQSCGTGATLQVATSTEFSQPVINSQIAALASTTANNITVSNAALVLIKQLIENVSGTSPDSQAVAETELNTLIANNELHTPTDLTTAQSQQQSVQNAMTTLTTNTPQLWAGTDPNTPSNDNIPWNGVVGTALQVTDPGVGWCNFKNQTTLQAWEQLWQ